MLASIGVANGADVSISPGTGFRRQAGEDCNLSCEFTFLTSKHFAQMWKDGKSKVGRNYFQIFFSNQPNFFKTKMLQLITWFPKW